MFAIVRTGGKQYRVAAGDIIAVEKLVGEAGDKVTFDDVLLAGDGDKIADSKGLKVTGEIRKKARRSLSSRNAAGITIAVKTVIASNTRLFRSPL